MRPDCAVQPDPFAGGGTSFPFGAMHLPAFSNGAAQEHDITLVLLERKALP